MTTWNVISDFTNNQVPSAADLNKFSDNLKHLHDTSERVFGSDFASGFSQGVSATVTPADLTGFTVTVNKSATCQAATHALLLVSFTARVSAGSAILYYKVTGGNGAVSYTSFATITTTTAHPYAVIILVPSMLDFGASSSIVVQIGATVDSGTRTITIEANSLPQLYVWEV